MANKIDHIPDYMHHQTSSSIIKHLKHEALNISNTSRLVSIKRLFGFFLPKILILLFQVFDLSVMMVNNTGCVVSPGGSCIISSSNLTFTTNSPGQDFDIKLEITDGPNYGKIQRLRSNGKWVTTKRFSQRQIEKEKISEKSNENSDLTDSIPTTTRNS